LELSIICVNWNSVDYLRACITSIYANTRDISFEIIIVDNASPQGGIDRLKDEFPPITIFKSSENIGFAAANNLGFRQSIGEHVLFLNPDTELVGPMVNTLLDRIRTLPNAGIVGCKMLNTDQSVQITSIQRFPNILNQIVDSQYLQLRWPTCPIWNIGPLFSEQAQPIAVEIIPGACMLLRRSVFERVGMFSEDYFMYAEDLDLNYKLKKAGYTNYYVGEATIIHHGGGSSSRQKSSQWATAMRYRAMTLYYRKTRGRSYEAMYRTAMVGVAVGRLSLLALMYPFGDKQSVRNAFEKWKVVLNWAIGRQKLALGDR
jgi:N-acetylglucosaminyl-diphospho-decaprenol L-rhamnosyltransferase